MSPPRAQIDIKYQMIKFNTTDSQCIEMRNCWCEIKLAIHEFHPRKSWQTLLELVNLNNDILVKVFNSSLKF